MVRVSKWKARTHPCPTRLVMAKPMLFCAPIVIREVILFVLIINRLYVSQALVTKTRVHFNQGSNSVCVSIGFLTPPV